MSIPIEKKVITIPMASTKIHGVSIIRWSPIPIPTRPTGINFSERLSCVPSRSFLKCGEERRIKLLVSIDHCHNKLNLSFVIRKSFHVYYCTLFTRKVELITPAICALSCCELRSELENDKHVIFDASVTRFVLFSSMFLGLVFYQ